MSDGQLEIIWMTRPSAPNSLIECVSCKCKTSCKTLRCSCRKSGLKCTEVCGCLDCNNGLDEENPSEENEEEDYLSDSSDYSDYDEDMYSDDDFLED